MVGVTATYGGLVAIDLETRMRAGQLESTAPFDLIGLPVLLAAIVLVWVCAMWVAIDLIRGGEIERVRAVDTLFEKAAPQAADLFADLPAPIRRGARDWASAALQAVVRPAPTLLFAYVTPLSLLAVVLNLGTAGIA
jgi:hypothetical protein